MLSRVLKTPCLGSLLKKVSDARRAQVAGASGRPTMALGPATAEAYVSVYAAQGSAAHNAADDPFSAGC